MAAGIAGAAAPASTMDALGSPGGGAESPAQPGGGMGLTPGSGNDADLARLQAFMGKLRQLDEQVKQTLTELPALQPFAQQWSALFSKIVQGAAKTAPKQTGSAQAVPTAGQ